MCIYSVSKVHWDKLQDFCQDEDKNKEPLMRIDQKV